MSDEDELHQLWSELGFIVMDLSTENQIFGPHDDQLAVKLTELIERIQKVRKRIHQFEKDMARFTKKGVFSPKKTC